MKIKKGENPKAAQANLAAPASAGNAATVAAATAATTTPAAGPAGGAGPANVADRQAQQIEAQIGGVQTGLISFTKPAKTTGRDGAAGALYDQALASEAGGDLNSAIQGYRQALAQDPNFVRARNNLGVDLLRTGNVERGLRQLNRAVAQDPSNPIIETNLQIGLQGANGINPGFNQFQQLGFNQFPPGFNQFPPSFNPQFQPGFNQFQPGFNQFPNQFGQTGFNQGLPPSPGNPFGVTPYRPLFT